MRYPTTLRARPGRAVLPAACLGAACLSLHLAVRTAGLRRAQAAARARLATYPTRTIWLSHGPLSYVDTGSGTPLLSLHGLYGGYDQALDNVRELAAGCRVVAPSRFGYPGSAVGGDGSPGEQAAALVALLDHLGIERAFVLGASAGGTPAIRLALDYPERVVGLILLSSAAPWPRRPPRMPGRLGPPALMNHDWVMWLVSPLFGPVLGMSPDTVHAMMPLAERRTGADLDATVTNRDMAVHFEDYPIEELVPPVLVVHAKDDRMAPFDAPAGQVSSSLRRYPHLTTAIFETGGHLIAGQGDAVQRVVADFLAAHRRTCGGA